MAPPLHINLHSLFEQFERALALNEEDPSKLYLYGFKTDDKHVHVVNAVFPSELPEALYEALLPIGQKLLGVVLLDEPRFDAPMKVRFEELENRDKDAILANNPHIIDECVTPPTVELGDSEFSFISRVFIEETENGRDSNEAVFNAVYKLVSQLPNAVFLGDKVLIETKTTGQVLLKKAGRIVTVNIKFNGMKGDLTEDEKKEYIRKGLIQMAFTLKSELTDKSVPHYGRFVDVDGQHFFLVKKEQGSFVLENEVETMKQYPQPEETEEEEDVAQAAPEESAEAPVPGDVEEEVAPPAAEVPEAPLELNFGNLLLNPHTSLAYTPKDLYSVIKSNYIYYHYDCDGFDDSGWGCAYRSLQTIWSWLNYKGRVNRLPPSHKEVQESLVSIGDKPSKFIGSRGWIGSFEIGFVLQNMAQLEFQTLSSSSGKELDEHGRRLAHHFEHDGAPVMIGGGQLAHTIIGVDYNRRTGECFYLILDPHYVGKDTTAAVFKGKGVSWQPNKFFNGKGHYNMLLVQN